MTIDSIKNGFVIDHIEARKRNGNLWNIKS
jgi:aspartate carbamoyltransferase regulatory subunit